MSKYGKDWRIHIGDGTTPTEVFTALGGEVGFDWNRQSDQIDLSSKDDGQYKSQGWGQQAVSFSVNGKVKLPDTALERVSDIAKSATPELNIKVMQGAVVKYLGKVGVGNFSASFPHDGASTYSFEMTAVAAPSTDDLGATS